MPVMPSLLTELTSLPVSEAARWGGALSVVYALMQFAFGPTLGNLSDRFGRRPVLLVSMFRHGRRLPDHGFSWHLAVLFIGRTLSGVAGATFSAASAFIADVSVQGRQGQELRPCRGRIWCRLRTRADDRRLPRRIRATCALLCRSRPSFVNFLFGYFMLPKR